MGSRDDPGAVEQMLNGIGEVSHVVTTINQSINNDASQVSDGGAQEAKDTTTMVSCGGGEK